MTLIPRAARCQERVEEKPAIDEEVATPKVIDKAAALSVANNESILVDEPGLGLWVERFGCADFGSGVQRVLPRRDSEP